MAGPAKLDRYREIRVLGSGGMGIVSLAEDTTLGRQVALKRVTAVAGKGGTLRLRREALVGAWVNHDNLVAIYDVDESEDGDLVIVMEYVEGQTLRDALARQEGGLGPDETLRILWRAAAGLDAIHPQGDRAPRRQAGQRAARGAGRGQDRRSRHRRGHRPDQDHHVGGDRRLTGLHGPEQLGDAVATSAIDVYALAAVAYEALSGKRARQQPNPVALAYAIETRPPPDLREAWPQAPRAAADVLIRGMDHDPARRPRWAGELIAELSSALRSPARPRVTPPPVERQDALADGPQRRSPPLAPHRRRPLTRPGGAVAAG